MALAHVSASLSLSLHNTYAISTARTNPLSRVPVRILARTWCSFASGSPLLAVNSETSRGKRRACKPTSVSIRCEQSTEEGNSLDAWLGRVAMVGFAVAVTVEIATGKGLLENFGLPTPLPTVALGVTGLVGVLTAIFIFQSASKNS